MTWQNLIWRAAPLLFVILIISYFASGFSAFPSALVAWGTILLAYATFSLIRHSKEQEDRRRKEEQAKENRDREERWLNEIIEWAIDVGKCAFEHKYDTVTGVSAEYFMRVSRANTLSRFNVVNARSEYVTNIASVFEKDLALHSAVKGVTQKLDDIINVIGAVLEGKATPEKISESEISLYRCVGILTKEATKIKTRDIGKKEENMSKEGEATGSNEPTLKHIEDHLKQQDNEMKKSNWLTFAAFGAAVALLGLSLAIVEDCFYYLVVAIGVVVMVVARINVYRIDKRK